MDVCEYCQHFPFNEQDILCPSCGAPRTLHLPSGTVLADGRFTIKNVIGQGGFGVTYQGTDALLARNIAIKELFPTGSLRTQNVLVTPSTAPAIFEQQKVGFINEFRVLARFSHPGIVRVHDVLEENGTAYAVMELLSGETLAQRIARQSRLPPTRVHTIARTITKTLAVIHTERVLHRDIKPDNIYLTADKRIVLIDFGSAHALAAPTGRADLLVSHGYSPLEQYGTNSELGPYTDLYALAATSYHALVGASPPPAHERGRGADLRPFPDDLPDGLRRFLDDALKLSIPERPSSAAAALRLLTNTRRTTISTSRGDHSSIDLAPGDNLTFALQTAPANAVLRLAPGEYVISTPLQVNRAVSLNGAGPNTTRVVGPGLQSVVHVLGTATFTANGVTFTQPDGSLAPTILAVDNSRLTLIDCHVQGGSLSEDEEAHGVTIGGHAAARLERCDISGNGGNGVYLHGQAQAVIEHCIVHHNSMNGIQFAEGSTGSVSRSRCQDNEVDGFSIIGTAKAELRENTCTGNAEAGITFLDSAQGSVSANTCESNILSGLWIGGEAHPTLQDNTCRNNTHAGILYADHSSGLAQGNTCENNTDHGISVQDNAQPTLEHNTCQANKNAGIAYLGEATGTARGNTCENNTLSGIIVAGNAQPTLEDNTSRANMQSGIV
ncbi:right-handed parallel beta-helix repeat-containing protein, partial [Deinococcus malanensis]|uniref:right-handed parallel beta-helix repeat-containing protein n=1 Tax=Deinococcus malanensis TaxID=1706855 RepID=UPI00166CA057